MMTQIDLDNAWQLLCHHSWIHDFQVTNFFVDAVWNKMPEEWQEVLLNLTNEDLNMLPFGHTRSHWPDSLQQFVKMATHLTLQRNPDFIAPVAIGSSMKRGMSEKKLHEVSRMALVVHEVCIKQGVGIIVDVGSGLGYLGQVLTDMYGYKVVGLESVASRAHGAQVRQQKSHHYAKKGPPDHQNRTKDQFVTSHCKTGAPTLGETDCVDGMESLEFELEDNEKTARQFETLLKDICKRYYSVYPKRNNTCSCKSEGTSNIGENRNRKSEEGHFDMQHYCSITEHKPNNTDNDYTHNLDVSNAIKTDKHSGNGDTGGNVGSTSCAVCMVGLHCCGDLTPTMLRLFTDLDVIQCMVCVSCCYHRMSQKENEGFTNLPMSRACATSLGESAPVGWCLSTYGLRLAAQETRARWRHQTPQDHSQHAKHVAFRGIVQLYLNQAGEKLKKCHRKVAKKHQYETFDTYIDGVFSRSDVSTSIDTSQLKQLYRENERNMSFIEPITALQVLLQPILESLICVDRQHFLMENDIDAELVPIFDENISPRNMAIVAHKK